MIADRLKDLRLAGLLALGALHLGAAWGRGEPGQDPPPPERPRQVWALLSGIESYEDGQFPRCRGAARDAMAMARWLIEDAGWGPDHVRLLIDREPAEPVPFRDPALRPESARPTRATLDRGVSEWLTSKVKPGDVVLIFFAGQAVSLPRRPDDRAGQPPRDFLIPCDARRDREETWWRPGEAIDGLAARGDLSIIFLLDTSPAGRIEPPRIAGLGREVPPELRTRMLQGIARWPGVTAWMAATERTAGETRDGFGLLTDALIRTLGTRRREPLNLRDCLHRLRLEPTLAARRLGVAGGFGPDWSLWPGDVRPARATAEPLVQRGHSDRVAALGFSGDGSRMFTAGMDSTVRVWRTSDNLLLRVIPIPSNGGARSLALSGDGRLLLAGGGKGDLRFFDLQREIIREPELIGYPHSGNVDRVAFLPGGRGAVSLDASDGRCLVWDVAGDRIPRPRTVCEARGRLLSVAGRPGGAAFALVVRDEADRQSVRLFDREGQPIRPLEPPGPSERITALGLSADGSRVVLGTESGRVIDLDVEGRRNRPDHRLPGGPVDTLIIRPLWLLAASGTSLHVLPEGDRPGAELALGEPIAHMATSADGRRVAACGRQGLLVAWEISADGGAAPRWDLGRRGSDRVLSLAFSPDGETLAAGEGDGRIRSWAPPAAEELPAIAPDPTGRIGHVAVARDGRALLQIAWDGRDPACGRALVWRFGDDSGVRPIPDGPFQPVGGFLPGGIVLIDHGGDVVVHRVDTLERRLRFEVPSVEGGSRAVRGTEAAALAISADGRRVAVGSGENAVVWSADDGRLAVKPFPAHEDKIGAVSLSADGHHLITAGDDGRVKLWDVAGAEARLERELSPIDPDAAEVPQPVTAAAFSPADARTFALGRRDGKIELWSPTPGRQPRQVEPLDGEVKALVFSPDGRLLAAAGDDRRITMILTDPPHSRVTLFARPESPTWPHHSERINALAFWPDGKPLLASASHDATIRLWRLEVRRGSLLGTLASSSDGVEWVVFTPDGLFDGSAAGERRVTWRLDPKWWAGEGDGLVARLDQLAGRFRVLDLADTLRRGEVPKAPSRDLVAPPRVILEPVAPPSPRQRQVAVRARISEPGARLRIYHNGVPVPAELRADGSVAEATVTLIGGKKNRIYAMASREAERRPPEPASIDGLSNILDVEYDGPTPGRTHVLALGISTYRGQPLRYAHEDARAIAEFLGRQGPAAATADKPPITLLNRDVTMPAVEAAFEDLRARVRRHPEDTVVIFLAGHTTIRRGQFCLLLPDAALPDRPLGLDQIALRAPMAAVGQAPPRLDDNTLLPYLAIDFNLSKVDALRRVVIVDACESEAIFDDLENRRAFRRQAEQNARVARTSYILATRRGEREGETSALEHGLLTYTLLRGLGKPDLRPVPELEVFHKYPTADLDHDGWIDTAELQEYARLAIPALAERFPGLLRGPDRLRPRPDAPDERDVLAPGFDRSASFPLVESPGPARP